MTAVRRLLTATLLAVSLAVPAAGPVGAAPSQPDPLGADPASTTTAAPSSDAPLPSGPGASVESTRTGPDPTGRPVPTTSQRAVDSAIWLWLVGLLVVAAIAVAVRWRDAPHTKPLVELGHEGHPPSSGDEGDPDDR